MSTTGLCSVRVVALSLILLAGGGSGFAQQILHVDAAATHPAPDGQTWTRAFPTLSAALKAVVPGQQTQIWVAASPIPYRPDPIGLSDPRLASFSINSKVEIYGGFLGLAPGGGETALSQANPSANVTTLSGDLAGNDASDAATRADNVYQVVRVEGWEFAPVVDGFTIRAGTASGPVSFDWQHTGGGLASLGTRALISRCRFIANLASASGRAGGGLSNIDSWATVRQCTFEGNQADYGGAAYNWSGEPVFEDCVFVENRSPATTAGGGGGGAVYNWTSKVVFTRCTFLRNHANLDGGGAYTYGEAGDTPRFVECRFIDNHATESGGGAYSIWYEAEYERCLFLHNTANSGGGSCCVGGMQLLSHCAFVGNLALTAGGAQYNRYADTTVQNCLMAGNTAGFGGAVYNLRQDTAKPRISSSTIAENQASVGGGIYNNSASPDVVNTLLWGNRLNENPPISEAVQMQNGGGYPTVTYSCIEDGNPYDGVAPFGGAANHNLDQDPLFVDGNGGIWASDAVYDPAKGQTTLADASANWHPGELAGKLLRPDLRDFLQALVVSNTATTVTVWGDYTELGETGAAYRFRDFHLTSASLCLDSGSNAGLPAGLTLDLDGSPRVHNETVDQGAYEKAAPHPADYDADGDVDSIDVALFRTCASRATVHVSASCFNRDFDGDLDVDPDDFGVFQRCYSGPGKPGDPDCVD